MLYPTFPNLMNCLREDGMLSWDTAGAIADDYGRQSDFYGDWCHCKGGIDPDHFLKWLLDT
jgi:hypothetical protein